MSKCISSHGEYSEHDLTGAERFACQRCWVLDEAAIMAALAAAEAEVLTLREQRDERPQIGSDHGHWVCVDLRCGVVTYAAEWCPGCGGSHHTRALGVTEEAETDE